MEAGTARVDGAAQKIQSKPARKQVQHVGSVKSRPLAGKSFYLDIPSGKKLEFLAKCVKRLGGVVESFLSKEVTCVVSNMQEARKERWGEKRTTDVLRKTPAGTQTSAGFGRGHGDHSCKPSDPARNTLLVTRGKVLLQKAIGSQSNTCGSNSILANARSWGVQIMHMDEMFSYLQWIDSKRRRSVRQIKPFPSGSQSTVKVMRLRSPFLKVEDESRQLCPLLQKFKDFPELYFLWQRRQSPFDPPQLPAGSKAPHAQMPHSDLPSDSCLILKRQRGYCECCEETFMDLQTHLQSSRHMAFAVDASHYAAVDDLISQMTNDFADSSLLPLPLRLPPAADGDLSGFQEDVLGGDAAFSGQSDRCSVFCGASAGPTVGPGSSAHSLENRSFRRRREFPREALSCPAPLILQSQQAASCRTGGGSCCDGHRGRGGVAEAPLPAAGSPDAGSRRKGLWEPPTLRPPQPRKRKRPHSPGGQATKRPALSGQPPSHPLPDRTPARSGVPPVDLPEHPFPHGGSLRTDPGGLQLPAVPAAAPRLRHARSRPPQGGAREFPPEHPVAGTACPQRPARPLGQRERPAVRPDEERHQRTPGKRPGTGAELSTPGFPVNGRPALQPCPPDAVLPGRLGRGLLPVSCSEDPSLSESEWDGPLFCPLEGVSRLPFKPLVDSALLGTRINLHDSGYESHLSSVLWHSPDPREGGQGDPDSRHGPTEAEWMPFDNLGASRDRLDPFFLNEPAASPALLTP